MSPSPDPGPPTAPTPARPAQIVALAGVNGAGKSSVVGAGVRANHAEYFNPDEATAQLLAANPGATRAWANATAWTTGTHLLQAAIAAPHDYTFETTLGGTTITRLLLTAADAGCAVSVIYVGLARVEQHLARVQARVARGGHDIPEAMIRARYDTSREHLIQLVPHLTTLRLFDNSVDADPAAGLVPAPLLLLDLQPGRHLVHLPLDEIPPWAKPIVMAAYKYAV